MGEGRLEPDDRYADAPVVGLTGARFGGAAGRRLRAAGPDADEGRVVTTHRLIRNRPVVGRTGARFGSASRQRAAQSVAGQGGVSAPEVSVSEPPPAPSSPQQREPQRREPQRREPQGRESRRREPAGPTGPTGPTGSEERERSHPDWAAPATSFGLVRPYTWTNGRTAACRHLEIETLVSATGRPPDRIAAPEHHTVVDLCARPRSVAELAALLAIPLGVARVLLADLADAGIVRVHGSADRDGAPDLDLMQRVLGALHRL
jgi:Protein of unknown function (DUF742)